MLFALIAFSKSLLFPRATLHCKNCFFLRWNTHSLLWLIALLLRKLKVCAMANVISRYQVSMERKLFCGFLGVNVYKLSKKASFDIWISFIIIEVSFNWIKNGNINDSSGISDTKYNHRCNVCHESSCHHLNTMRDFCCLEVHKVWMWIWWSDIEFNYHQ